MILEKPLYKKKIVINNKKKSLFPTIKTTNFQTIINFILLILLGFWNCCGLYVWSFVICFFEVLRLSCQDFGIIMDLVKYLFSNSGSVECRYWYFDKTWRWNQERLHLNVLRKLLLYPSFLRNFFHTLYTKT